MHKTLPDTLERLSHDHLNMRAVLNALGRHAERVASHANPDPEFLSAATQYLSDYPRGFHHPVEDMIFSRLQGRAPKKAAEIAEIDSDHREAADRVADFAMAVRNVFLDTGRFRQAFCRAVKGFIAFKREHMRREESGLFRHALENLSGEDWREIDQAAVQTDSPEWRADRSRYGRLYQQIVSLESMMHITA